MNNVVYEGDYATPLEFFAACSLQLALYGNVQVARGRSPETGPLAVVVHDE